MPWWTILAFAIGGGLVLAALAVAGVMIIGLFRGLGDLARSLEPHAARLEQASLELARRSEVAAASQARLAESTATLGASLARLSVLSRSLDDARSYLRALRLVLGR